MEVKKRKGIGKTTRFNVFKRDNFSCQYCASKPPKVVLEIDHIIPVSKGGKNNIDNLITACFDCNRGKRNNLLDNVPESLHDKMERMKLANQQFKMYSKVMKEKMLNTEKEVDMVEDVFYTFFKSYFTNSFRVSVKKFIENLGVYDVIDSMERSCAKIPHSERYAIKYFCGVCWNKIKYND